MKKYLLLFIIIILAMFLMAYESLQGPTGVLYWNEKEAYNGYTLFATHGAAYLIDMQGNIINTWNYGTNPRFLDNGNILDVAKDDPSNFNGFQEIDWEGNIVWQYYEKRENYAPHHDFIKIFNKKLNEFTLLYIANKFISNEQATKAGADTKNGPYQGAQMDAVVEVDMKGNIVWEWWFFDHVIQNIDPKKENYVGSGKKISDYPGKININLPGRPLSRDWLHCNSIDYNETLGHILINSVQGEFYIIDHDSTFIAGDLKQSISLAASEKGDFLYRFGDPARYEQGDPPKVLEDWTKATGGHKQIGGSHDAHWIKPGLPGEGNIIVFNNGQYLFERTGQSYILEINPFFNSNKINTGKYVNPPDAGYYILEPKNRDTHKVNKNVSNQIVWSYSSKSNQGFFSHIGSSSQRLPNGNTLICSDTEGHFFEITKQGELVWEFINPVTKEFGIVDILKDNYPMTNSVFRAYRYDKNHPALKGRDLKSKGTFKENAIIKKKPDKEGRKKK